MSHRPSEPSADRSGIRGVGARGVIPTVWNAVTPFEGLPAA